MQRVRERRKALKQTQKQFAEQLEIPLGTYREWEQGRRKPPEYLIKLILKVTEI